MNQNPAIQASPISTYPISAIVDGSALISSVSVFRDMIWDRTEFVESRVMQRRSKINWKVRLGPWWESHHSLTVSFMEYAYALLLDPIPDELAKDMATVVLHLQGFRKWLAYLTEKGIYAHAEVTHAIVQDFVQWMFNSFDNDETADDDALVENLDDALLPQRSTYIAGSLERSRTRHILERTEEVLATLRSYYRYSKRISEPLPINPLHGVSIYEHTGMSRPRKADNRTPVIPKDIWDVFLCAAVDYVENYSNDILLTGRLLQKVKNEELAKWHATTQNSPGKFAGRVVTPRLAEYTSFAINRHTGEPWHEKWKNLEDFREQERMLYYASLTVVLALSAMRETEISLLEINSHHCDVLANGTMKYSLTSRVIKGDSNNIRKWVVNKPVYRSLEIIKELTHAARDGTDTTAAFIQNWQLRVDIDNNEARELRRGETGRGKKIILPLADYRATSYINIFAKHLRKAWPSIYNLPQVDGEDWHFTTRQFRRSLAPRIAREPFGMVAGMLHYKHLHITTFQGYAGSDPSFLKVLEEEELDANEEFLSSLWKDLQEGELAGPKGVQLARDFKRPEFLGTAGDLKKNAMQYFIESHRGTLHVGLFNYCFFDRSKALCLNGKQSDAGMPNLSACHPDRCANSCVTRRHLPQWQIQVDDAQSMLNHKWLSPPQKYVLTTELERAMLVVNRLGGKQ